MVSPLNQELKTSETRTTFFDRFFRDQNGRIVIAQKPNLPAVLGTGAAILQFVFPEGNVQTVLTAIAFGTLYTWAWLELFQGASYFRRSLGLISLAGLMLLPLLLPYSL